MQDTQSYPNPYRCTKVIKACCGDAPALLMLFVREEICSPHKRTFEIDLLARFSSRQSHRS